MALVKDSLKTQIFNGLHKIMLNQSDKATSGDENENPADIVRQIATDMAEVIADAVDTYIKSGDIMVGPNNVSVTSAAPGSPSVVAPLQPAKMQ